MSCDVQDLFCLLSDISQKWKKSDTGKQNHWCPLRLLTVCANTKLPPVQPKQTWVRERGVNGRKLSDKCLFTFLPLHFHAPLMQIEYQLLPLQGAIVQQGRPIQVNQHAGKLAPMSALWQTWPTLMLLSYLTSGWSGCQLLRWLDLLHSGNWAKHPQEHRSVDTDGQMMH